VRGKERGYPLVPMAGDVAGADAEAKLQYENEHMKKSRARTCILPLHSSGLPMRSFWNESSNTWSRRTVSRRVLYPGGRACAERRSSTGWDTDEKARKEGEEG
jgi:hypothetical protein